MDDEFHDLKFGQFNEYDFSVWIHAVNIYRRVCACFMHVHLHVYVHMPFN